VRVAFCVHLFRERSHTTKGCFLCVLLFACNYLEKGHTPQRVASCACCVARSGSCAEYKDRGRRRKLCNRHSYYVREKRKCRMRLIGASRVKGGIG